MISLEECEERMVYRLHSRNLTSGVYVAARKGFIGIREKFGSHFLFTEYHHDTGPPYGTATPLEKIGEIPIFIPLKEHLGSIDSRNARPVAFDKPVADGGRGWYYTDTNEEDREIRPLAVMNTELFQELENFADLGS